MLSDHFGSICQVMTKSHNEPGNINNVPDLGHAHLTSVWIGM